MTVEARITKAISTLCPESVVDMDGSAYAHISELKVFLGEGILKEFRGKTVIDFGCGSGDEVPEIAQSGVGRVIGVDMRDDVPARATQKISGMKNATVSTTIRTNPRFCATNKRFEGRDLAASWGTVDFFSFPWGMPRTCAGDC
jgi:SAM-dependent methyltransferase